MNIWKVTTFIRNKNIDEFWLAKFKKKKSPVKTNFVTFCCFTVYSVIT